MRTLRSITLAAGVAALVVALASSPAGAKGPRGATIEGPGLAEPIEHPNAGGSKLPDLVGIWGALWDDSMVQLVDEPPTDDLGPAYVITWDLGEYVDEAGQSSGEPNVVRQTVYPYAAGSPLVHTEAGQPFYAQETSGGWFVAHPSLRDTLISLGLPTSAEAEDLPDAALPASPSGAAADGGDGGDEAGAPGADEAAAPAAASDGAGWVLPVAVAAAGLAVIAGTAGGLVRRRKALRPADAV